MAKLRHIAIPVPAPHYKTEEAAGARGRDFVGVHHFGFLVEDVAAAREAIEAAGGKHWMGEPTDGTGFYEVKYHHPSKG